MDPLMPTQIACASSAGGTVTSASTSCRTWNGGITGVFTKMVSTYHSNVVYHEMQPSAATFLLSPGM